MLGSPATALRNSAAPRPEQKPEGGVDPEIEPPSCITGLYQVEPRSSRRMPPVVISSRQG
jgi:hypothetical protein